MLMWFFWMLLQYLILGKLLDLYAFRDNHNFIEDLFSLFVTAESINVTNICNYRKLLLLFILLILELTYITFCCFKIF